MSCHDCSNLCLCVCGSETKTQIILYPIRPSLTESHRFSSIKMSQRPTLQMGRANESTDSISKLRSLPSTQIFTGSKSKIFCDEEEQLKMITEENKQNQNKINSRSDEMESGKATAKICKQNLSNAFCSYQASCITSKRNNSDITILLLERQNCQLQEELARLKKQQAQLLSEQTHFVEKNNRQLRQLKQKSEDLRKRSCQRKKQIEELNQLLSVAKKHRKL